MDPENPKNFFSHKRTSQRAVLTSLEKQLGPMGPIASRWEVRISISKETQQFVFCKGSGPLPPPLDPLIDGEKHRSPCMLQGLFLLRMLILLKKSNNVVFAIKHVPIFSVILRPDNSRFLFQEIEAN